jgi:hypothetical protein
MRPPDKSDPNTYTRTENPKREGKGDFFAIEMLDEIYDPSDNKLERGHWALATIEPTAYSLLLAKLCMSNPATLGFTSPMTAPLRPPPSHIYTIGHSTRTVPELAALLLEAGVDLLVDVRTVPRSRANPQFNADSLPAALKTHGIAYRHLAALGGLRGRRRSDAPSPNTFWDNASFRNYADYAMTPAFHHGLDELLTLARQHTCANMCAEAVWWRCHRRIVADYLIGAGNKVDHIMGPGKIEPATITKAAAKQPDGTLVYAAETLL